MMADSGGQTQQEHDPKPLMNEDQRIAANNRIVKSVQESMDEYISDLHKLRHKLTGTYIFLVAMSVTTFLVGVVLLLVPVVSALQGRPLDLATIGLAGIGFADIVALLLARPLERMHDNMGDMSQIIVALSSHQIRVGLRLMEMNVNQPPSVGQASVLIGDITTESIKLVQEYFESTKPS